MEDIRMPREKAFLNLEDIRAADANTVAASFLSWLGMENGGQIQTETMRHSYANSLTAGIICRDLLASAYNEKYNLYNYRGLDAVNTILQTLELAKGFEEAKRSSGGSGVFQASFNKYKKFWKFLEEGGTIKRDDVLSALCFVQTMQQENVPGALPLQESVDAEGMTLEEQIVEITRQSHYIVLETLSRVIQPDIFVNVKNPKGTRVTRDFMAEVKRTAEELCALPNAQIGKLDPTDARNFLLNEDVYYSVEWLTGQVNEHDTLTIAGVIGLSLYDETQEFSALRYRQTGKVESVLRYQGIYEWFCARNHQKMIDFESLSHFLAHFMKMKVPFAFKLAESLEKDQSIRERQRAKIVRKLYEGLAARFRYSPASQKLRDIEEMPMRRARALQDMTPEERLLHSIFGE